MADQEFDDAKLIYDLLAKSGRGISEDSINEIARTLDISISNEKLKERVSFSIYLKGKRLKILLFSLIYAFHFKILKFDKNVNYLSSI